MLFQNQGTFVSFDDLDKIVESNIDILSIAGTELDKVYPNNHFTLEGYHTTYRLERIDNKGGLMVFVKLNIPSKTLTKLKISSNT